MWSKHHSNKEVKVPKHLQSLVENSGLVDHTDRQVLARLIADNVNIFASVDGQVRGTDLVHHYIHTGDHHPIRQPPHCLDFHKEQLVQDEVTKMLVDNVIEESGSP